MLRLIYTNSNLPLSYVIRFLTWSEWSHVGILTPENTVIDSHIARKGVTEQSFSDFISSDIDKYEIKVYDSIPDNVYDIARTQIGKPYDWTAVCGIPFRRNWQEDDSWFCSELVAWACKEAGRPLISKPTWRITQQDIYETVA